MVLLSELIEGYRKFKAKYVDGDKRLLKQLAQGQRTQVMVLACCDSRVDPALLLQCKPGDLFVARSIANFVMPFNKANEVYQGLSAALEFGVSLLKVKHLIILGHSQCGGIEAFLKPDSLPSDNDFMGRWLSLINVLDPVAKQDSEACAKAALLKSYENCLTFPWIKDRVTGKLLQIHLWFFDICTGSLSEYQFSQQAFQPLA